MGKRHKDMIMGAELYVFIWLFRTGILPWKIKDLKLTMVLEQYWSFWTFADPLYVFRSNFWISYWTPTKLSFNGLFPIRIFVLNQVNFYICFNIHFRSNKAKSQTIWIEIYLVILLSIVFVLHSISKSFHPSSPGPAHRTSAIN